MSGFLFVNWGRKLVAGVSFVSVSWILLQLWGTIIAHLPEYSRLYQQMRESTEVGFALVERENLVRDRIQLKHWLCVELAAGRIDWQAGLETFSWLNQTAQTPEPSLLVTFDPDTIDPLYESLNRWVCTTDPIESEELACELRLSFENGRANLKPVGPVCHPDLLLEHRRSVELATNSPNP